jgi:3-phosphoshikimate 1-carboxyvinyltransferase
LRVRLPPSKSVANRALVLAALAKGASVLRGLPEGGPPDDVAAMLGALRALGAGIEFSGGALLVRGGSALGPSRPAPRLMLSHGGDPLGPPPSGALPPGPPRLAGPSVAAAPFGLRPARHPAPFLDVGAAGTALRFLLPLAALHCRAPVGFSGAERLFERPLEPLLGALASCGASWSGDGRGGVLSPPARGPASLDLEVDGGLSSQFASGLAMAAAGLPGGGTIRWAAPRGPLASLASWGYLALTRDALEMFACPARLSEDSFAVPGGALRPADVEIPGDWSAAAPFFCAAAVLGGRAEASPLGQRDSQPDRAVLGILGECGSTWVFRGDACVFDGRLDRGVQADLSGCPDLAPCLAAAAVAAPGPSLLRGLGALPHKESDRLAGILRLVAWAGGRAEKLPGPALAIHPADGPPGAPGPLRPFDPQGDHRMAFAAAVASLRGGGVVADPACVAKSFPGFWEEWGKWGPSFAPPTGWRSAGGDRQCRRELL